MSTNSPHLHILTEPPKYTCNAFQNTVAQTMINAPPLLFGMCQTAAAAGMAKNMYINTTLYQRILAITKFCTIISAKMTLTT